MRRQLAVFGVACLVISWGLWLAAGLSGGDVTGSPAIWLFAVGASGPSLAALVAWVVLRRGGPPRTRLAAPWIWLPVAVVVGALPAVVAELVLEPAAFGADAGAVVVASGGALLFTVTYLIAGPLAEEFGWRGYLQPRLRTRWGVLATALVLGVVWAIWHVPLFFLDGTGQNAMGIASVEAALFFVALVPASLSYLFVSERLRGGVWAAIAIHFAGNASLSLLPQRELLGAVIVCVATVVVALVCAIVWWRMDRRAVASA